MQMINLDTHILIYALLGEPRSREKQLLESNVWSISAIVLWELAKLVQLGRIEINLDSRTVIRCLNRIKIWPITFEIACKSTQLDFQGDPADELISATSIVHNVPLLTRDRSIRSSCLIPFA